MFGIETMPRRWVDWVGVALTSAVLLIVVALGLYGSFLGFLQTKAYEDANEWVALGMGVVGAGCALYLLMEFTGQVQGRQILVVCLLSGMFSVFAVTKGVPASVTQFYGKPGTVRFVVSGFDWGGKGCPRTVVAANKDFEEFRTCIRNLEREPRIGEAIEIGGMVSDWGIVRERVVLRR